MNRDDVRELEFVRARLLGAARALRANPPDYALAQRELAVALAAERALRMIYDDIQSRAVTSPGV